MKKIIFSLVCVSAVTPVFADGTNQFADEKSRVSYAIGMNMGLSLKQNSVDLDDSLLLRGLQDAQSGQTQLTEVDMRKVLTDFQTSVRAKQQQRLTEMAAKDKADGDTFLAANKGKPGVELMPVTLPTGAAYDLQYIVVTDGTGEMPAANDTVTVNYRGTFIDGTEFDSSAKAGHPASFPVGGVIPGWTAALEKMTVGAKWKLFIPSELAYGAPGNRVIPPNSTLIFDVELLSVQKTTPSPPPAPAEPLTSDIIKVPSKAEMDKGAKIETIPAADAQKLQQQQQGK